MANGISTLLQYNSVMKNYDRVITQFEKDPQYKNSVKLIRDQGPAIDSVDALLKNRKALQVALSAFQLEDQINSTGIIRKLLTEDPADPKSLANRLSDPRYLAFAKAFADLKSNTAVLKPTNVMDGIVSTYQSSANRALDSDKSSSQVNSSYFRLFAQDVQSIDGLLSNGRVLSVALGSCGIFDLSDAVSIKRLLSEDPTSPSSLAQTSKDSRYMSFATKFSGLKNGEKIWDSAGAREVVLIDYADQTQQKLAEQTKAIAKNVKYFTDNAANYTSPEKLLADPASLKIVATAFGLDTTLASSSFLQQIGVDTGASADYQGFLQKILSQDPSDPNSVVNRVPDTRFRAFAQALASPAVGLRALQSTTLQDQIATTYQSEQQNYLTSLTTTLQDNADIFNNNAQTIFSAGGLTSNTRMMAVALGSYGIFDLTDESQVQRLVNEDPNSPQSLAQTSGDSRYLAFAQGVQGLKSGQAIWSDPQTLQNTLTAYNAQSQLELARQTQAGVDNLQHFRDKAGTLDSANALMADKTSLAVILSAYNMDGDIPSANWQPKIGDEIYQNSKVTAFLRKVITEDPASAKSTVAQTAFSGFKTFALSLQGLNNGMAIFTTSKKMDDLITAFRANEFEKHEGDTDPALREALYFKRNATGITSAYQIMGNKALYKVVRVALGLPEQLAALDAKQQKSALDKKLDVTMLSDPKFIDKLIKRFLANTDAQDTSNANPLLSLFDGSASSDGSGSSGGGLISLLA